jgi:hypothetical protein
MNMKILAFIILLLASPAFAQQQPNDTAFQQRAIAALQAQRNQAMDNAAAQQARADGLAADLATAQARIKELEPKPDAPK